MNAIDLNCDVGEGVGNEAQLMPYISSCNIACGGHAGDMETMKKVLAFAKANHVKPGAHPSYPDKENFGREVIDIPSSALKNSIISQIKLLQQVAEKSQTKLFHVKPHGALYNRAAQHKGTAQIVIDAVLETDDELLLYVPYNSIIGQLAQTKLRTMTEGFADRAYNDDYSLVSRKIEGAVFSNVDQVVQHVLPMIKNSQLTTINKLKLPFNIDTLCVHGDTQNAFEILKALHASLIKEGISIGL